MGTAAGVVVAVLVVAFTGFVVYWLVNRDNDGGSGGGSAGGGSGAPSNKK